MTGCGPPAMDSWIHFIIDDLDGLFVVSNYDCGSFEFCGEVLGVGIVIVTGDSVMTIGVGLDGFEGGGSVSTQAWPDDRRECQHHHSLGGQGHMAQECRAPGSSQRTRTSDLVETVLSGGVVHV